MQKNTQTKPTTGETGYHDQIKLQQLGGAQQGWFCPTRQPREKSLVVKTVGGELPASSEQGLGMPLNTLQ